MEETRELAAVSARSLDYSSKHTRLRYQTVLTALILYFAVTYGIEELKIPGVLTFKAIPNDQSIIISICLFYFFSLASFVFQTQDERARHPVYFKLYKARLEQIRSYYQDLEPKGSRNLFEMSNELNKAANRFDEVKSESDCLTFINNATAAALATVLSLKYHSINLEKSNDEFSAIFPGSESGWSQIVRVHSSVVESANAYYDNFKSSYGDLTGRQAVERKTEIKEEIRHFANMVVSWSKDLDLLMKELQETVPRKIFVRFIHKDFLSVALPIVISILFFVLATVCFFQCKAETDISGKLGVPKFSNAEVFEAKLNLTPLHWEALEVE